jgi:hypothetical protein
MAHTSNYALRLLASVKAEAEKVAVAEGTTLNQFINVAVAEKLAALRTAQYFQDRASRADLATFDRLLTRTGEEPPRPGDEIDEAALRFHPPRHRQPLGPRRAASGNKNRPGIKKRENKRGKNDLL